MPANNVLETWAEQLLGVSSTLERGRRDRIGACVCVCLCVCARVRVRVGCVGSTTYML